MVYLPTLRQNTSTGWSLSLYSWNLKCLQICEIQKTQYSIVWQTLLIMQAPKTKLPNFPSYVEQESMSGKSPTIHWWFGKIARRNWQVACYFPQTKVGDIYVSFDWFYTSIPKAYNKNQWQVQRQRVWPLAVDLTVRQTIFPWIVVVLHLYALYGNFEDEHYGCIQWHVHWPSLEDN